jgi:uncharacterized protein YfaS (alpha-2-macroglobulin family)
MKATPPAQLTGITPKPEVLSANSSSAGWRGQDLARLADFVVNSLKPGGSFVLRAAYRTPSKETTPVTQGMKVDRVVKNLTDVSRDGSASAPFRLGDQIFISYRFSSEKPQSYVAVEDMIPGGLEVVNPNLELIAKFHSLPPEMGVGIADLSHSEMRDQQTNLYFNQVPAGSHNYGVLARATAAGSFIWPATQVSPMYDSRFFGRSASGKCIVTAE